jgi:hypothetical protein
VCARRAVQQPTAALLSTHGWAQIKVKYQRQGWESQTFTMTRGHQRPTPPVAAGGSGAGSGSTSRACVIS